MEIRTHHGLVGTIGRRKDKVHPLFSLLMMLSVSLVGWAGVVAAWMRWHG